MKSLILPLIVAISLVTALLFLSRDERPDHAANFARSPNAVVEKVIDGDTIVATINGESVTIRLIGIDTPEVVDPRKDVECFGPEASEHTKTLLPPSTDIYIERDTEEFDRFDRLLGYVYRSSDGLFINENIISGGFGVPMFFEPNTTYERSFRALSRTAKNNGVGLFAACSQ